MVGTSEFRGTDFTISGGVEATVAGPNKDLSLKASYMQALAPNVAAGVMCKLGMVTGAAEAKVRGRYVRGES